MANPAAVLLPRAIGQGTTQIFRATVAAPAPSSYADVLYVTVGDWTSQFTLPPISSWDRGSNGGALPSVGDACLVVRDNVNVPHVVLWDHVNTIPAWQIPTLVNSWGNVGAPSASAAYLKDPMGFVHLRGTVQNGSSGTTAFVLPAGYRPVATITYAGSGNAGGEDRMISINSSGSVSLSWAEGASTIVSMDVATFLAEN